MYVDIQKKFMLVLRNEQSLTPATRQPHRTQESKCGGPCRLGLLISRNVRTEHCTYMLVRGRDFYAVLRNAQNKLLFHGNKRQLSILL